MRNRLTQEQANAWYAQRPYITGCNYYPSEAVNLTEMWQEYDHERIFSCIGRELALAHSIGLNSVRTIFPFELWRLKPEVFFRHVDEFLAICERNGITVMPVLFDDCCVPRALYKPMQFGAQPEPQPGYFGGSDVTCFEENAGVGYNVTDDHGMQEVVREYIRQLAEHYGDDPRILMWNVWNEPGNSGRGDMSLA